MLKVEVSLNNLKKLGLDLNDSINESLYQTEDDEVIALYDYIEDDDCKGILVYSNDESKIGEVDYYQFSELKEIYKIQK